jgi:hypothetical protein
VQTDLGRDAPMKATISTLTGTAPCSRSSARVAHRPVAEFFFKPADLGAQTSLHVAVASELAGVGGQYFAECVAQQCPGPQAYDAAARRRLWTESARMVGEPGFDTKALFTGPAVAAAAAAAAPAGEPVVDTEEVTLDL